MAPGQVKRVTPAPSHTTAGLVVVATSWTVQAMPKLAQVRSLQLSGPIFLCIKSWVLYSLDLNEVCINQARLIYTSGYILMNSIQTNIPTDLSTVHC